MSNADTFNKKAASPKSKPDEILKALNLEPGHLIVDLGCGGGYFTFRFSEAVGKVGQVFALDTDNDNLKHIRRHAQSKNIGNIILCNAVEGGVYLPDNFFDLVFLRNVYHHLENRATLMSGYKQKLKKGGRVAIVEHKPGVSIFNWKRLFGHNVPKETIEAEMNQAGFKKIQEFDFLPEQSFTIYQK